MTETTKIGRFWHWACNRGFVFIAYVATAIASIALFLNSPPPPVGVDFGISSIAAVITLTLILSASATAHAVIYGLHRLTIALIKLEIPSLRLLSLIIGAHGFIDIWDGDTPSGAIQIALAVLLFHEMRLLSFLRKGTGGGLI